MMLSASCTSSTGDQCIAAAKVLVKDALLSTIRCDKASDGAWARNVSREVYDCMISAATEVILVFRAGSDAQTDEFPRSTDYTPDRVASN